MNPLSSGSKQHANNATTSRNSINDVSSHNRLSHNTFDFSYHFYNTERYGDVTPFYVAEGVSGDKNPLRSSHVLKSFATKSPLMTGLSKKKGYFAVPYKAILPNNYSKVFVQPKKGDDVPSTLNTVFESPWTAMNLNMRLYFGDIVNLVTDYQSFERFLKCFFALEMFFSHGSLLNILGYKIARNFYVESNAFGVDTPDQKKSFDWLFDNRFAAFFDEMEIMISVPSIGEDVTDGSNYFRNYVRATSAPNTQPLGIYVTKHRLIEIMRDNPDFQVVYIDGYSEENGMPENVTNLLTDFASYFPFAYIINNFAPLNYARLAAYQIAHRVFFSNDDIDNIYTAELYRQNLMALYFSFAGTNTLPVVSVNGVNVFADVLSGAVVSKIIGRLFQKTISYDSWFPAYLFLHELFAIQKSLRFGDYFLGSRLEPLAVGDVNAPVTNSNVSAIDTTRSIQMQRFLNFVNKIPSQLSGYIKKMFGVEPAVDLTEPSYIAVSKCDVSGFEVENTTSDDQGNIVLNLVSNDSSFAFEVDIADPSIIIGVTWYEMPRIYSSIIERQMLHEDRMDMFQPMLQYLGDQDVKACEYDARLSYKEPFAYTLRNMEYKQRVHQASGGFVESLPSWSNVIDNNDVENTEMTLDRLDAYLLRSRNYEFNRFFSSLAGYSLGTYFHFIVKYNNENNLTRPMAVSPQILG